MHFGQNGFDVDPARGSHMAQSPSRVLIDSVRRHLGISETDLRIAHWACGGNTCRRELSAFLAGEGSLSDREYDTLAAAMNDELIERNLAPSVPYSED